MISVNLIGSGNVGFHLFKSFSKSEQVILNQWYSRDLKPIAAFKQDVDLIDNLQLLTPADVTIIAVSDDAVAKVSTALPFTDQLVVHTSGAVGIHDLDGKNDRGVFYPLQTFSKAVDVSFSLIPICYEAVKKSQRPLLKQLAHAIGSDAHFITTDQRQVLHLAAVYVNNFSNHLYRIAHEISDAKHIDFNILKPLIQETARKVEDTSPYMAQTGPAKRNDKKTIKKHLKLIENDTHKAIYSLLTKSIKNTYGN